MADGTKIEWTDATWNPIRARNLKTGKVGWHCEHVTPGCEGCYAEGINKRLGSGLPFKPGHREDVEIFLDEKMLDLPYRWRKPRMIFPLSMTDMFAPFITDHMRRVMFEVMRNTPHHAYQVLTKRPDEMRRFVRSLEAPGQWATWLSAWPIPNIWLGVSCEDQQRADERVPILLDTPAAVRWVSAEPLLGPIDFANQCNGHYFFDALRGVRWHEPGASDWPCPSEKYTKGLDWIVAGGESGARARPMHPDWARAIRDQCAAAGVAFHFKQWGNWVPIDQSTAVDEAGWRGRGNWMLLDREGDLDIPDHRWPDEAAGEVAVVEMHKARAGRLLDGVTYDGYPEAHQ